MSEKDVKGIVLERCKELGIKSSNRGLIAGASLLTAVQRSRPYAHTYLKTSSASLCEMVAFMFYIDFLLTPLPML